MNTIKSILGYILGTTGFVGLFIESDYCTKLVSLVASFALIGLSILLLKASGVWDKANGRA